MKQPHAPAGSTSPIALPPRETRFLRALDLIEDIGGSPGATGSTIFFVATELRRRWPELSRSDSRMELSEVPISRLNLIENTWIVSTYLRMRNAGLDVRIADTLEPGYINVCTSEALLRSPRSHEAFIVVAQGDRAMTWWADFLLVQSPAMATGRNTCLIDHWPQPNLVPRDPGRGATIERVGYVGYLEQLGEVFKKGGGGKMEDLGVEFVLRETPATWHDYSDLDLCLAIRDVSSCWIRTKPATKLTNAWLAGCPALLGPEPAYRYWGEPGVDYFEVATISDVARVLSTLRADADIYRRAVEIGRQKASLHNENSVLHQWAAVLGTTIQERFEEWRRTGNATARRFRCGVHRVTAPLVRKIFSVRARGVGRTITKMFGKT